MIPDWAMSVVLVLRRDVPRPKQLPELVERLSGNAKFLRWADRCPMGLHPDAKCGAPVDDFPPCSDWATRQFAMWWDVQTDAEAAVKEVWG
jgi:hypothetical protein